MKKGIHPDYHDVVISCACGEQIHTRSTRGGRIEVEVCSKCHPFFTGEQKLIDTAGRIDKFNTRYNIKN